MTTDPRAALNALVAALERHLAMAGERRGKDDPALIAAYQRIANAFVDYDDALLETYGEVTPLDVYSDDGEDDDYDEDDLDAEDHDGVDVDSLDEAEDETPDEAEGDSESDEDEDDDEEAEPEPATPPGAGGSRPRR
ncbi:MAG TPA: hypothetical protein VJ976_09085 [Ornithinimicrobium sp.]|uniref:hypothetical protein n=1 Tax=Ornithinimicrobium sp. TaxID=1977084 RepID=UPI002B4594B1|nr:hypothetical protein [Ornithinimicrobium sp.]HKJ12523.1 hypothetical protein [Ornithinimicrobium sp.]